MALVPWTGRPAAQYFWHGPHIYFNALLHPRGVEVVVKVGELFGFPIYTHLGLPPGEVALVGVRGGLEVKVEGGELVLRRIKVSAAVVIGAESDRTRSMVPVERQVELLLDVLEP